MKRKEQQPITQEELAQAINRFVESGGIIRKLPEQKTSSQRLVGARWNASELGAELSE